MKPEYLFFACIIIGLFLLEALIPFRREGKMKWRHYLRNAGLYVINGVLTRYVSVFLSIPFFILADEKSIGLLRIFDWPTATALLVAIVLHDIWIYFWHRANHQLKFLWRFHKVHHSDTFLDLSSAVRFHPIESLISAGIYIIVIIFALGLNLEQVLYYKLIFHTITLFHHSNIRMNDKLDSLFRILFVSPNMHRVHHSTVQNETDSNFANIFSLWDRIFGTYKEKDPQAVNCGIEKLQDDKSQSLKGMLLTPFGKKD